MAGLGRSNSLSINTGGSLFGNQTSQGQQSAGLFGSSTNAASQPQQTGGLFGSTSQAQTGGLFGGATSQPPQSTGLFGSSLNKPQATTGSTGGLFGASTSAPQSQPQQGTSLFGGALGGGNTQTQSQPSQSGGLFGGLGQNQNQSQNQQKPSLFGPSTTQQNTTPSLFGNTQQQNQNTTTPSLFGNTQQNRPQQTGSLFGGMASQNNPLGGGLNALGQSTNQVIQMNDPAAIKGINRVSELGPDLQRQLYTLDDDIHGKIQSLNKMRETYPAHVKNLELIAPDVEFLEEKLSTVALGLENDASNISHLRNIVQQDENDALLVFRAAENQALPAQFRYGNASNLSASAAKPGTSGSLDNTDDPTKPVDLISYFNRRTDDLGRTLDTYQRQIREIEAHLRTMEAGAYEKMQQLAGARNKALDDRQQLVEALRAIEAAIVDSAKKVGRVRDEVTKQTLGGVGAALL